MDIFFVKLNELPNVLIDLIEMFLPKMTSVFLSKKMYLLYHPLIYSYIKPLKIENYIRCMVKQDNDFVLVQLLKENGEKWSNKLTNYYFREQIFVNYITFLEDYAMEYNSLKCQECLRKMIEEKGFRKKNIKRN
jgi:hypothetical protein